MKILVDKTDKARFDCLKDIPCILNKIITESEKAGRNKRVNTIRVQMPELSNGDFKM